MIDVYKNQKVKIILCVCMLITAFIGTAYTAYYIFMPGMELKPIWLFYCVVVYTLSLDITVSAAVCYLIRDIVTVMRNPKTTDLFYDKKTQFVFTVRLCFIPVLNSIMVFIVIFDLIIYLYKLIRNIGNRR